MSAHPMRDWPDRLRLNAVSCTLAQAIYYARSECWGVAVTDWAELEPREKQTYIEHAADILGAVRPLPRVSRPDRLGRVIAQILPGAPYGETTE